MQSFLGHSNAQSWHPLVLKPIGTFPFPYTEHVFFILYFYDFSVVSGLKIEGHKQSKIIISMKSSLCLELLI